MAEGKTKGTASQVFQRRNAADVAIVGAGPAGAVCALLLARAGHDVVLVDRAPPPRQKACGECLSPRATRMLADLGLLERLLAVRPARLGGWRIIAPSGRSFADRFARLPQTDPLTRASLAVDRATLDGALAAVAAAAGARLMAPFHVSGVLWSAGRVAGLTGRDGMGRPRTLHARNVVGADGLRSRIALAIGAVGRTPPTTKLSMSMHLSGLVAHDDLGEMYLGRRACLGIAPLRQEAAELCNVTIVVDAADSAGVPAARRWDEALRRFPLAAERLHDCRPVGPLRGARPWLGSGAFVRPTRHVTAPGCLLVGDAAGYFDPFTGQGICHALADARAVATCLSAVLRGTTAEPAAFAAYAAARRRRAADAHAMQRGIDAIVRRPALAELAVAAVAGSGSLRRALLAATGDLLPPRALLSPSLALTFVAETLGWRSV